MLFFVLIFALVFMLFCTLSCVLLQLFVLFFVLFGSFLCARSCNFFVLFCVLVFALARAFFVFFSRSSYSVGRFWWLSSIMSNSANSKFQPPQSPQTLGQTLTPYYVSCSGRVPVRPTFRAFFSCFFVFSFARLFVVAFTAIWQNPIYAVERF